MNIDSPYQKSFPTPRFFNSLLADWLQQFERADRQAAYDFVRNRLIFVSYAEMQHLVECFFPNVVEPVLVAEVAARLGVPRYEVWRHEDAEREFTLALRKSLFIGLSDGARMDVLRRANERRISNEQVLVTTQVNESKWSDALSELRNDLGESDAQFSRAFLLDDFVGSGRTLLRQKDDGIWTGKLQKFRAEHKSKFNTYFASDWILHVHHYISSHEARERIGNNERDAREALAPDWFGKVSFSYGLSLPAEIRLTCDRDPAFWALTERYYDAVFDDNKAIQVGGDTAKRGFGECGLPLILEHNTPNNSVALLWAETSGEKGHTMRPLFRRAQRHW